MTRSAWAAALIAAPVAALAIGWLVVLAVALTGTHPIWDVRPRNLSEAAAFRDGGSVVRRVWRGDTPTTPAEVRAGFISEEPVTVTAIEAAVDARRPEIVQLLLDLGGTLDASAWHRAWCDTEDTDVRAVLEARRPAGATSVCTEEQTQP
jgi:hypothetical protein